MSMTVYKQTFTMKEWNHEGFGEILHNQSTRRMLQNFVDGAYYYVSSPATSSWNNIDSKTKQPKAQWTHKIYEGAWGKYARPVGRVGTGNWASKMCLSANPRILNIAMGYGQMKLGMG